MSEPRYRDWILETIDSLRSRKARPDLERICRMVRRRHGSDPERTRAELEKLIQERTVLKVSYKGSISYRNAARVQRKGRRTDSGLERPSHDGARTNNTNNNTVNNNINNSGGSNNNDGNSRSGERVLGPADREHEQQKPEPSRSESSAKSSRESCGGGGSSAAEARERQTCGESDAGRESLSARAAAAAAAGGGHALLGLREILGCLSAREQDETLTRRRARALQLEREMLEKKKNNGVKKNKAVVMMMMTKSKNKAGRVQQQQQQQQRGTAACVLAHTGSGGGGGGGAEGARLCSSSADLHPLQSQILANASPEKNGPPQPPPPLTPARARQMTMCFVLHAARGAGGAGGALFHFIFLHEEEKDEEPMETESEEEEEEEEEEKVEEEGESPTPVDTQTTKGEGQAGVTSQEHSPVSVSLEVKPSENAQPAMMPVEKRPSLLLASPPPAKLNSLHQEADSEGDMMKQVASFGTACLREEQRAATPNQLQTNIQNQAVVVLDNVVVPSSIPIKSYSGCKTEVGVSSCLLTPSASPGAAEERGMNGGVFVKSESTIVNPVDWTVADVASYFTAVGFPEQALAFRTQMGKSLLLMQRNDVLTGLSIRLGPALKIYERHVKVLQRTHFQDDGAFC
ncbi:atherin [Colossoma macropomum]|uniref:atherin n=1 Tax=Colossoma macropomum TaxID=42526 RepID=UPI0018646523|nr:atherin [Colossoma macropomum]